MIRKGVLSAALGAGALALLFGTAAPSYVKTAFHRVRHNVKGAVPIQFQIERARQQVADLEPAIHLNRESIAGAEYDVAKLEQEISATQANLTQEGKEILALRNCLDTGELRLTGSVSYTPDEIKADLSHRMDHFKAAKQIALQKEQTLKARRKAVLAGRKQLAEMSAAKQSLLTKIDEIESRLKMIEATQASNEFTFDDSELARVKESVSDLEKQVSVMATMAEQEGRLVEKGVPVLIVPTRDVLKEIDAEFGTGHSSNHTADKSL